MIYTPLIQRAIRFAIKTHDVYQKQKRKGKNIAYITHPLTVGLILSRAGAAEHVIAAGILHDTIEDSIAKKKVSIDILAGRFGKDVANIVLSVTETNKELSWEERKKEVLEHIEIFSTDALLVKSADIISNASELLDDFDRDGERVFDRFNAPKQKILEHYDVVIGRITERWPENPLAPDLTVLNRRLENMDTNK